MYMEAGTLSGPSAARERSTTYMRVVFTNLMSYAII